MKSNGEILFNKTTEILKTFLKGSIINKINVRSIKLEHEKDIVIELTNGETYLLNMFWKEMRK